jgi:ATP-binding cassette, subfamily B, multidrug efflux pump
MVQKSTLAKLNVVKQLGGVAEETLTAIKVVSSFTREERELRKFSRHSRETMEVAKKASATMALMVGLMKFSIFFFYAYTLYVGSHFIQYNVSDYNGRVYDQQIVI